MAYKLTYWDAPGRAEPIRLIFAAAKVSFEDIRISKKDDWPSLKKLMPWDQVPILESCYGPVLAQSMSICRYLARKYGLVGSSEWDAAKCDEYVDALNDIVSEMKDTVHAKTQEEKKSRKLKFLNETMPECLVRFEQILSHQRSAFLVGNKLTWSDIVLFTMLERLEHENYAGSSLLDNYKNLRIHKIAVCNYPGIKEWVEKRKTY